MKKSKTDHSPATREAARFVSDWLDNTAISSSSRRTEPKVADFDLERSISSSHPIKATRPQAGAGRTMYFGNDVLLCDRNIERSKPSAESRVSKDARFSVRKGASFGEPSHTGESSVRRAVLLGRSWSELLSTPPGTVISQAEEQRDSQLAVLACRVAGVETSPRTSKRTSSTRTGKNDRSSSEAPTDQDLFVRERELFLRERALFMRERECFLAEKQRFHQEKEQLLRLHREETTPPASPADAVAETVRTPSPSIHLTQHSASPWSRHRRKNPRAVHLRARSETLAAPRRPRGIARCWLRQHPPPTSQEDDRGAVAASAAPSTDPAGQAGETSGAAAEARMEKVFNPLRTRKPPLAPPSSPRRWAPHTPVQASPAGAARAR
jgi:hypothetical protein